MDEDDNKIISSGENDQFADQQNKQKDIWRDNVDARKKSTDNFPSTRRKKPFSDKIHPINRLSDLIDGIDMRKTDGIGRHLVATKNLAACMKIGEETPFAKVIDKTSYSYCLTCNSTMRQRYDQCLVCKSVVFCHAHKCRKENKTHRYECGSNFHGVEYGYDLDMKCAIQMVFETLAIYKDDVNVLMGDVNNMLNDDGKINYEIPETISDDKSRFRAIMRLQGKNEGHLDSRVEQAYATNMELSKIRDIFDPTNKNYQRFLQLLLAHFLMVLKKNSFEQSLDAFEDGDDDDDDNNNNNDESLPKIQRIMIFATVSFFNHSCSPNVLNFTEWNSMTLITSRPIQRNEQLCTAYKHFDQNVQRDKAARQALLKNSWGFECQCERCNYAREINDDDMNKTNDIENPDETATKLKKIEAHMKAKIQEEQQNKD